MSPKRVRLECSTCSRSVMYRGCVNIVVEIRKCNNKCISKLINKAFKTVNHLLTAITYKNKKKLLYFLNL